MIGVKFKRPVTPYGVGDTALLPDDVARRLVNGGDADRHNYPKAPHSKEMQPSAPAGAQKYRTKSE